MNLFDACINYDEKNAVRLVNKMVSSAKPSAIWAVLMHAAAWHEQRTYDTPHSTILTYSIHRMIEEMGHHPGLLSKPPEKIIMNVPGKLKGILQMALIERLARHLAAVDHWARESGPRYGVDTGLDSLDNALRYYEQFIREKRQMGAMKAAVRLASRENPIRLRRMTASLAAEEPDILGHAFIMPVSLVEEIPAPEYTRPVQATMWHLTEYLVRKVPGKRPDGFAAEECFHKMLETIDLSKNANLLVNAVIEYGALGHNGIFAHRIADAARTGLVENKTIDWMLTKLKRNIGDNLLDGEKLNIKRLIKDKSGTNWDKQPSDIGLPHYKDVRNWFSNNLSEYWNAMMDLKSATFEAMIPNIGSDDWESIRAAQYAMSAINGTARVSHVMIFSQAVWSLADMDLVPTSIAALQVHRMLREYLKDR